MQTITLNTYGQFYPITIELECDVVHNDPEYNTLDLGVGKSTVKVSDSCDVIEQIYSGKIIECNGKSFDRKLSDKWLRENEQNLIEQMEAENEM